MKNNLQKLYELGQSPWYDNIDRRLINSGELKKLFEVGIVGVTSNPTIFEKAVSASDVYDAQIRELARQGKEPEEIYDEVTIADVREAADLLKDTFESTKRIDGYVSIEVLPEFAHDAAATIDHAKKIFKKVGRENILIKVPGTKEGPEAIRALIREGINVNVTLLFSVEQYEASARAYIQGLMDRVKEGKDPGSVISVASVFVSRIDTKLDPIFESLGRDSLKGKIAVANTKMIYQRFKQLFSNENFGDLMAKGARVQRVLWGSTSTKNPAYSDVKYVEELIGEMSINTMPHITVDAFLDHGRVELTIEENLDDARKALKESQDLGINISDVCQEIQDAGVAAFQASFEKLIGAIKKKVARCELKC